MFPDEVIVKELLPKEKILWCGQPSFRKTFTKFDIFLIPFSIFWFGFAIFWTVTASVSAGFPGIFGIPFLVVGFYFAIGRFIVKKANKRKTHYAITNRRVICITVNKKGTNKKIAAVNIENIPNESISLYSNGVGSIIFGQYSYNQTAYLNTGMDFFSGNNLNNITAFFDVEEAESVYKLFKNTQNQQYTQ